MRSEQQEIMLKKEVNYWRERCLKAENKIKFLLSGKATLGEFIKIRR